MAVSAVTIEQLARDTVHTTDPETALRALTALRRELDAVERDLVTRALSSGASWSDLARSLGISKQAAHRKYRHLSERDGWAGSAESKLLVTAEARHAIQLARKAAAGLGQPALGTEHILLGILHCRRSHAVLALNALGVTYEKARRMLQTTMPGVPTTTSEHRDGVTRQARRILDGSVREALERGDGYIGVEHLLLSLLSDSRNGAVQTLEALRTTPEHVRRQLEEEWRRVVAPPAE